MPSRNEQLADHYLSVSSIAAICVDPDGMITAYDAVGIGILPGYICFCCVAGRAVRLAELVGSYSGDQAAVVARIKQLADDHGIGITRHAIVIERALSMPPSPICRPPVG